MKSNHGEKKEVVSFRKTIPANTPDVLHSRIKADGTIEEVRVRFYSGQQRSLHVYLMVEHKGNKLEHLLSYAETGEGYLSGDDDYLVFPIVVPVQNDDYIKIRAVNVDGVNSYTLVVDVVVDYYAGKNRIIGGVI